MSMKTIRKGSYSPGFISLDDDDGDRVNKVVIEFGMRKSLTSEAEFHASASVRNKMQSDILYSGQILDEVKEWFPNDSFVKAIHAVWKDFHGKQGIPLDELAKAYDAMLEHECSPLTEYDRTSETGLELLKKTGLSIEATFVPYSAVEKERKEMFGNNCKFLTWNIAVRCRGSTLFYFLYSQGAGHSPAYKTFAKDKYLREKAIALEVETGCIVKESEYKSDGIYRTHRKIAPPADLEVMSSFLLDCQVLEYGGFKDWADCMGFDDDSIKAKNSYDQCLERALQLKSHIGDIMFYELMEVIRD